MDTVRTLLIGGPPGAGKTTLARSVAARLGFLSTTVDDLVTTARMFTDAHSQPDLHRSARVGALEYFTEGPPDRLIEDSAALEGAMWPVLEQLMRRHETDKGPIVMDWWLLNPDKVAALTNRTVRSVWLHIDPAVLDRRERSQTAFREGSSHPDQMHSNFMQRSLWRNQLVLERATALGLPVLHQPGDKTVDELTEETLRLLDSAR